MGLVHFIESGVGTPLVLLHAFPVDARMWNAARTSLEEHARVIAPDQRGLGESALHGASTGVDEPAGPVVRDRPSMAAAAADVIALLDELGLERVVLGGCSMGGYVAMAVLRAAPERVAGLVLADTKAVTDNEEQRANRLSAADRAEREGTDGWLSESTLPNVLGTTTRADRLEVVNEVRDIIETQPPEGVAWAQRAMADRPDSTELLRGYSGPVLVVVGEEDVMTPPDSAAELAGTLPNAELVRIPGAGHLSPVETPAAFSEAVASWLGRIS
ncbi:alpha/beta fold hydrolase [Saccharopolyspora erythraea]|uniref:alpha/beta fold hydrolase n=1 Tax=Saccharopolyspora erythraea TaxID=1836 RepID=UPI0018D32542|nr:alpha/beta fold hydrolase [Saccharopolyspora erythraea]QRK89022.1 alpha/beta fold hydrolase [Saccharopolyspora erythraea]